MILRFCVCIPTFNNAETIQAVVTDTLRLTPYSILVVDDGSTVPVRLEKEERVSVIRLEKNQGKGVALQAGLNECLKRGFTHMISIDGDGQHLPSEIDKLVKVSITHPWDFVIGSRRLVSDNVPGISKFGRNFSNFWVRLQTSHQVSDSQSGFRIYPLFHTQTLRFWTRKFDFEIEVLIRLLWRGVEVKDVEIECYYPSKEERVSHFHKFWDNLRISCLNTVLVVLSLLRAHRSPRELASAVGMGVWIGCTPFFGFHTFIVAAFAFLFRLNAIYLWLGSQISIPLLAPFLAAGSIAIGGWLRGDHTSSATSISLNWLLGSMVLGPILGVIFGVTAFLVSKKTHLNPVKKSNWNGRIRGGRFGNDFLKTVIRLAGLKTAYAFLYLIVPYFYIFAPKARRSIAEYWRIMEPRSNWWVRQWRILCHFYIFAQTLLDRAYQNFHEKPMFEIHRDGIENILRPIEDDKGLILMSAHVGSWELAARTLKADGLTKTFHQVQYEYRGMTFEKALKPSELEHVKKLNSNESSTTVFEIRNLLTQGLPVGLMGDRPTGGQFELVQLFGKLAPIDCTPFRIAAACEVPLVMTFGWKGKKNAYDFCASTPKLLAYSGEKNRALEVLDWAQDFANELEKYIRIYPNQWFNFFPLWSSIPTPPEGIEVVKSRNYSREQLHKPTAGKAPLVSDPTPTAETVLPT